MQRTEVVGKDEAAIHTARAHGAKFQGGIPISLMLYIGVVCCP